MLKIFLLEIIILLFAILAGNYFIFNFISSTFKKYFYVLINNLKKKLFVITFLIGSSPLRITSSDSNESQNISSSSSDSSLPSLSETVLNSSGSSLPSLSQSVATSSDSTLSSLSQSGLSSSGSSLSETVLSSSGSSWSSLSQSASSWSWTSADISVFEGLLPPNFLLNLSLEQVQAVMTPTASEILSNAGTSNFQSLIQVEFMSVDSRTILNSQSFNEWREIVMELYQHPINTPAGILQQIKFEELNILFSQDIIHFAITQTELRLIIEMVPAMSLYSPDINYLLLTIMSYYHL